MPYNYLVDPEIRFLLKFDLNNAVIIFDEAHNVPSAQEDVSSFEVTENMLSLTLYELKYLKEKCEENKQTQREDSTKNDFSDKKHEKPHDENQPGQFEVSKKWKSTEMGIEQLI